MSSRIPEADRFLPPSNNMEDAFDRLIEDYLASKPNGRPKLLHLQKLDTVLAGLGYLANRVENPDINQRGSVAWKMIYQGWVQILDEANIHIIEKVLPRQTAKSILSSHSHPFLILGGAVTTMGYTHNQYVELQEEIALLHVPINILTWAESNPIDVLALMAELSSLIYDYATEQTGRTQMALRATAVCAEFLNYAMDSNPQYQPSRDFRQYILQFPLGTRSYPEIIQWPIGSHVRNPALVTPNPHN